MQSASGVRDCEYCSKLQASICDSNLPAAHVRHVPQLVCTLQIGDLNIGFQANVLLAIVDKISRFDDSAQPFSPASQSTQPFRYGKSVFLASH